MHHQCKYFALSTAEYLNASGKQPWSKPQYISWDNAMVLFHWKRIKLGHWESYFPKKSISPLNIEMKCFLPYKMVILQEELTLDKTQEVRNSYSWSYCWLPKASFLTSVLERHRVLCFSTIKQNLNTKL